MLVSASCALRIRSPRGARSAAPFCPSSQSSPSPFSPHRWLRRRRRRRAVEPPVAGLVAVRALAPISPIEIDGVLDEPVWQTARGRRARLRDRARREQPGAGRDHLPPALRQRAALRRLHRRRPRPGGDPRPLHRPRPGLRGRLRGRPARPLPRPPARFRVLRQSARGPDGPLPRRPGGRAPGRRRQRGHLLGCYLGLGRPDHRRRLRGRARDSLLLAPLPARRRRADLGHRLRPGPAAARSPGARERAVRPQPQLLGLPVVHGRGLRRDLSRPPPRARSDAHRAAGRAPRGRSGRTGSKQRRSTSSEG